MPAALPAAALVENPSMRMEVFFYAVLLRYQLKAAAYLEKNIIDGPHCTYFPLYTLEIQIDVEKYFFIHITLCRSGV